MLPMRLSLIFTATSFISPDNWGDINPLLQRGRN